MAGQEHGDPVVGQAAQQHAQGADPGRVEAVGGLVEQQQPRPADQAGGEPEPLAHALGVVGDRLVGAVAQLHGLQHLVDLGAANAQVAVEPRLLHDARDARQRGLAVGQRIAPEDSRIVPAPGRTRPSSMRIVVVFPAPLGPMKP
jgi:hypothetical protein